MLGALLTSLYTYRLIFLFSIGPQRAHVSRQPGPACRVPLIVLCVLSLFGGFVDFPPLFGGVPALSNFLNATLPALEEVHMGPDHRSDYGSFGQLSVCAGTGFCLSAVWPQTA